MSDEEAWNKVNGFASIVLPTVAIIAYAIVFIFIEKDWAVFMISTLVVAIIPRLIYHEVLRHKLTK